MLEQNIQMALSKGDINLEDAIDIREIRNLKLANQLLKVKRKAKQEARSTKRNAKASNDNLNNNCKVASKWQLKLAMQQKIRNGNAS